jgi:hypothetical protein
MTFVSCFIGDLKIGDISSSNEDILTAMEVLSTVKPPKGKKSPRPSSVPHLKNKVRLFCFQKN